MFAGGRLHFLGTPKVGEKLTRQSEVTSLQEKVGRSGPLVLVTVRHLISSHDGLIIREEQDIVYRFNTLTPANSAPKLDSVPEAEWEKAMPISSTLLFRFSAPYIQRGTAFTMTVPTQPVRRAIPGLWCMARFKQLPWRNSADSTHRAGNYLVCVSRRESRLRFGPCAVTGYSRGARDIAGGVQLRAPADPECQRPTGKR